MEMIAVNNLSPFPNSTSESAQLIPFHKDAVGLNSEEFIEIIKDHQSIWNQNLKSFYDRKKKMRAWESVCKKVDPTYCDANKTDKYVKLHEIKKKWANLRDYYRKEVKKSNFGQHSRNYKNFKALSFLRSYIDESLRPAYEYESHDSNDYANDELETGNYECIQSDNGDSYNPEARIKSEIVSIENDLKCEIQFDDSRDISTLSIPDSNNVPTLSIPDTNDISPLTISTSNIVSPFSLHNSTNIPTLSLPESNPDPLFHLFQYYATIVKTFSVKRQIESKRLINDIIMKMELEEQEEKERSSA